MSTSTKSTREIKLPSQETLGNVYRSSAPIPFIGAQNAFALAITLMQASQKTTVAVRSKMRSKMPALGMQDGIGGSHFAAFLNLEGMQTSLQRNLNDTSKTAPGAFGLSVRREAYNCALLSGQSRLRIVPISGRSMRANPLSVLKALRDPVREEAAKAGVLTRRKNFPSPSCVPAPVAPSVLARYNTPQSPS